MKFNSVFLSAILAAVLCISGNVFAVLSGGGTEANPYLIQSRADFDEFANPANATLYWASGKYTKLMCDLSLSDTTYTQAVIAPDTVPDNYGFDGTMFTGVFDGNGHTIFNVTITAPTKDWIGLFGFVYTNGQIKNLGIENVNITGREYVSGLVGINYYGILTSCYVTGSVSGAGYSTGGLVGRNYQGTITSCYAAGVVNGTGPNSAYIGGLVGENSSGSLTDCYATNSVTEAGYSPYNSITGGLVGLNINGGTITSCYATGAVSGIEAAGGLVGANELLGSGGGIITSCYATGAVISAGSAGGLVAGNSGTLIDCYATGSVTGNSGVGGLAGVNGGTITSCYATGSANSVDYVGGLAGSNGGSITSSYATGSVVGNYIVGGLVGYNDLGTITNCYATGSVTGIVYADIYVYVGGLVGQIYSGSITDCYATGLVTSEGYALGGLVGDNNHGGVIIANCFWDIQTTGMTNGVGYGIEIGIGKTTAEMMTLSIFTSAGWDFSSTDGDPADWQMPTDSCPRLAWETVVATPTFSPGGGAYSYGQNVTITCATAGATIHYTTNGLDPTETDSVIVSGDFVVVSVNPTTTLKARAFKFGWDLSAVKTAIYFFQTYSGGTGTAANPYRIANVADFQELSTKPTDWSKSFILTADIDLTDLTLSQAPIAPDTDNATEDFQGTVFSGFFDGNGHTISNLTIIASAKNYIGLFGYVGSGGQILNLGVENVNITGYSAVGGLVGYNNHGSITSCNVTGLVKGTGQYSIYVGGLVGYNEHGSAIDSCYATGSVSGTWGVGGLVGSNRGSLTFCNATGSVSGDQAVGGLVGGNYQNSTLTCCYATESVSGNDSAGGLVGINYYGSIASCYATGSVSDTSNVGGFVGQNSGTLLACFWDTQTGFPATVGVGSGESTGVAGKTTVQMKTLSTFTSAGWDFVGENANGTEDIWRMILPGSDYPRLAWETIQPIASSLFFPMSVGQKYIYRQSDPYSNWTVQLVMNRQAAINSQNYFHLQNFNYGNEFVWNDWGYLRSTENQIYNYQSAGAESLELQKGAVGTKWNLYEPDDEYNYKVIEIVSVGPVTVPYGTFAEAYKYQKYKCVDPANLSLGQSPYWYEWFVPGVGFVKDEDYYVDGPAPVIQELMSITYIGDFNNDGDVNLADFAAIASAWLSQPGQSGWNPAYNVSYPRNSVIDWNDLSFLVQSWME